MKSPRTHGVVLVLILLGAGTAMTVAGARSSATFDEIALVASGVKVLEHGGAPLLQEQPPLASYLYGLPVWISGQAVPPQESGTGVLQTHWEYGRDLYFRVGNDPETVARLARSVATAFALGLIALTFAYGRWIGGAGAGLLAAGLVAFLPDVLAHGAVAYNDVPLALAYLATVWALDVLVRRPGVRTGALVGVLAAAAMGIKYSAVALGPVAVALLVLEGVRRREDGSAWMKRVAIGTLAAAAAAYLVTVVIYRGDVWLLYLEAGLRSTALHAAEGHPAPAYLLGETRERGFWYFFPLAFLFKTPAALHLLLPVALWGLLAGRGDATGEPATRDLARWRPWFAAATQSRLRGPAVGLAVFGVFLLRTGLNVGFRYALPVLPPLLLLVAVGLLRSLSLISPRQRIAVALLLVLYAGSTLSVAPHWLGFRSEWVRMRSPGREALIDSSVDWGQGLIELRDYMRAEGLDRVRLSYFGSALPEAYGVAYEPLPSFFPLMPPDLDGPAPAATVISVTNLHGLYFEGADPFASYRNRVPDRVLAGSLYVYDDD